MSCEGFQGGPGSGADTFGSDDCGHIGSPIGFGCGGWGFGHGRRLKRAVLGTAAQLLDGPADAAQIVQRTSEATGGAFAPPREVVELAIEILAAKGFVTVDDGVATLTELGRKILALRGVTSQSAQTVLGRAGRFAEVMKMRTGLREVAGMARTIMWSGTEEQKAKLAEVRGNLGAAISEARKTLHATLAEG